MKAAAVPVHWLLFGNQGKKELSCLITILDEEMKMDEEEHHGAGFCFYSSSAGRFRLCLCLCLRALFFLGLSFFSGVYSFASTAHMRWRFSKESINTSSSAMSIVPQPWSPLLKLCRCLCP